MVNRFIPTTDELDGQKLFTVKNGHRLATPLFSVLMLVEVTDVVFAVDSVPAVLAVSREQFIVFASNAFAACLSSIVRKLRISDTGDSGRVGSWSGLVAAQRPSSWIAGSASLPHSVSS